jgi:PKD repeat protein
MMRIYSVVAICFALLGPAVAQTLKSDSTKREAEISYTQDENLVNFTAITPPLQQIQGAPTAFYTFYWEFGDGHYSFDPKPKHAYKKTGEHSIQLWTTNNYDNGKPPPSRPQKIQVKKIAYENTEETSNPGNQDDLRLQINRAPVPNEEIVLIASYKNTADLPANGKLYLFYNEEKFKADNFTLEAVRTHNGERQVQETPSVAALSPLYRNDILLASAEAMPELFINNPISEEDESLSIALDESRLKYRNAHILELDSMEPGEERNIFCSLKTTAEMLKDTNAIITIRGVYVPDRGKNKHTKKDLEMEIVTSHDPNKMAVSDARLNYRFVKNKVLQFKVRFQNNGEGPARSIKLNVDVSDMFDKRTVQVMDIYPKCPICPDSIEVNYSCLDTTFTKDKIIFHFKNIYLPGSRQNNVHDKDSTRGFVKYSIQFSDKVPKSNTVNRTAIIFDKNEPVLTNYSSTRFKPGLSLGASVGYQHVDGLMDSKNFFAALSISPYKPHKGYWQAEVMFTRHTFSDTLSYEETNIRADGLYDLFEVSERLQYTNLLLSIVPASYRYNVNKVMGFGAGLQVSTNASGKTKGSAEHEHYLTSLDQSGANKFKERDARDDFTSTSTSQENSFTEFNAALFGDVVLGSSRIGPALGIRYYYYFEAPRVQWQFYATWKF